jgi:hypothetical protein
MRSIADIQFSFMTVWVLENLAGTYFSKTSKALANENRVSGFDDAQANTQIAILAELSTLVRAGQYTGSVRKPSKVAHFGHSFGSFVTNGFIAARPELSDAAILTGIAYNGSWNGAFVQAFGLRMASEQSRGKWGGLDNNYVTWVDKYANEAVFFNGDSYDKDVLRYTEENKQPMAAAEFLSVGLVNPQAPTFTGPVMVSCGILE